MNADGKKKREAWDVALGLMKIDVEPSKVFLEEVDKEVRGEITPEEMLRNWEQRHKQSE